MFEGEQVYILGMDKLHLKYDTVLQKNYIGWSL